MNNYTLKPLVTELISKAMDVHLKTTCMVDIQVNMQVAMMRIVIGHQGQKEIDYFNPMYSIVLYFFDDDINHHFEESYLDALHWFDIIINQYPIIEF